ncbi:MAG: hypothetical protein ACR2QH_07855, partial [Geminicoccaceae bacterium]
PPMRIGVFVSAHDCEIIDTWHTGGLRGAGSHDFQITDVLVPERRTFAMGPFAKTEPGKLSQRGFGALTGVETSVVGLGIARCAIDTFKELAKKKTPYTGTMVLASLHPVQEKVGTAEALLRSGRAFLYAQNRHPVSKSPCKSVGKWVMMNALSMGAGIFLFIPLDSGSHHDHFDLLASLHHHRFSRYAWRVEKPTSAYAVLGRGHASPLSGP